MLFEASCWRDAMIWVAFALRDAAVCANRLAMCKVSIPEIILTVSSSDMSSNAVRLAKQLWEA